jgi:Crinkler effector protein N-terminal domain
VLSLSLVFKQSYHTFSTETNKIVSKKPSEKSTANMVMLVCALVGQKGSAFAIEVDENKSVDALKDAIAVKQKYEFAASKLQLFLGKQSDGTWLDSNNTDALTTDASGHPEGFMHMDQLLFIKNPRNFGERFEFNEGEIHLLVVAPGNRQEIHLK